MTADPSTKLPPATDDRPKPSSFYRSLPGAFVYPFRKMGWAMIVGGAIFFTIADFVATYNIWFFGLIAQVFLWGYLSAFLIQNIAEAADGQDSPPDWPSVTNLVDDILRPFLLVLGALVVSFAPLIAYMILSWPIDMASPILWVLLVVSAAYLPMALIAVALYRSVNALNPITVIGGIVKTMPAYLVAAAAFFLIYAGNVLIRSAIAAGTPFGISPLAWALSLYFLMVEMYILGRLYYTHSRRLGWFE